jgi:hypothetical protein
MTYRDISQMANPRERARRIQHKSRCIGTYRLSRIWLYILFSSDAKGEKLSRNENIINRIVMYCKGVKSDGRF